MNFLQKIAYSMQRFMYGRYGSDNFSRFLSVVVIILLVLNIFLNSLIVYFIELLVAGFTVFRFLSKNKTKRYRENSAYLKIKKNVTGLVLFKKLAAFFKLTKNKIRDRKTHVYKKCPHCREVLRLPRVAGTHDVRCPCCGKSFKIKI